MGRYDEGKLPTDPHLMLRLAIETVAHDYDVIVIDSAPNLGDRDHQRGLRRGCSHCPDASRAVRLHLCPAVLRHAARSAEERRSERVRAGCTYSADQIQ